MNPSMRRDTIVTENLYASIKEASIHRSNSMSTIPSQHNDRLGAAFDCHNRSMDLGPVCSAGGEEHNLTYSYSSSEESLNESINTSFPQSSLKRKDRRMSTDSKIFQPPYLRNESLLLSPQVQKTISIAVQPDQRLGNSSKIVRKLFVNSRETTMSRSTSSTTSNSSVKSTQSQVPMHTLNKMELILKKATKQSEDLSFMFKKFEAESHLVKNGATIDNTDGCMASTISNLGKSIKSFQSFIGGIEREASKLNKDVEYTQGQVVRALAEAEKEKCEFDKMRNQVEHVLLQLKGQSIHQGIQAMTKSRDQASVCSFPSSQFPEPGYECHTFPRCRVKKEERNSVAVSGLVSELEEDDEGRYGSGTVPLYAQVRKPLRSLDKLGLEVKKVVGDVDMQY